MRSGTEKPMANDTQKTNNSMDIDSDHDLGQITLTLEDDSELLCDILAIFPCDGKEYIALFPVDGDEEDVFLYQFVAHDEDDMDLINIESDEEFDNVSEAFDALLDSEEFDELYGEDEEDEEA